MARQTRMVCVPLPLVQKTPMGDMLNTNMRLMGEIVSNKMGMEMVEMEKFKR